MGDKQATTQVTLIQIPDENEAKPVKTSDSVLVLPLVLLSVLMLFVFLMCVFERIRRRKIDKEWRKNEN